LLSLRAPRSPLFDTCCTTSVIYRVRSHTEETTGRTIRITYRVRSHTEEGLIKQPAPSNPDRTIQPQAFARSPKTDRTTEPLSICTRFQTNRSHAERARR
jgi:hypothetical protein